MSRSDLERLSREELIELVLRLQRPEKTSRTSSKRPATDRKERREQSKPGGAKPGHEGHNRVMSDAPDMVVEHLPDRCACCGGTLHGNRCRYRTPQRQRPLRHHPQDRRRLNTAITGVSNYLSLSFDLGGMEGDRVMS